MRPTNGTQMDNCKQEKEERKRNKRKKYNKCTVNESDKIMHKQLTIVTSDLRNQLSNKTKPSLINIHWNNSQPYSSECPQHHTLHIGTYSIEMHR